MKKLLIGSLAVNVILLGGLAYVGLLMPPMPTPTPPAVKYVFTNAPTAKTDQKEIRALQSDASKSCAEKPSVK